MTLNNFIPASDLIKKMADFIYGKNLNIISPEEDISLSLKAIAKEPPRKQKQLYIAHLIGALLLDWTAGIKYYKKLLSTLGPIESLKEDIMVVIDSCINEITDNFNTAVKLD